MGGEPVETTTCSFIVAHLDAPLARVPVHALQSRLVIPAADLDPHDVRAESHEQASPGPGQPIGQVEDTQRRGNGTGTGHVRHLASERSGRDT